MNALSSKFLEVLNLKDKEFLIADTDAGIEHFGRGVEKAVDILLVVIDPSRESILLAKKISELGQQADKPVYYILNRVSDKETQDLLMNSIDRERVIAVIPEIREIFLSGLAGNEINIDVEGIKRIADILESKKKSGVKG
jgi:CO dehydrogenase maturation factor